jgi:hypothetical protein
MILSDSDVEYRKLLEISERKENHHILIMLKLNSTGKFATFDAKSGK